MKDTVIAVFRPDRAQYWRDQAWLAAAAMAGGMAVLWAIGSAHIWTGAVGGLAAIALRSWYLASEELSHEWRLSSVLLHGPNGRMATIGEIVAIRGMGSSVQIITKLGDKHLIKYNANVPAVIAELRRVTGVSG